MILKTNRTWGFLRHNSRGGIYTIKKERRSNTPPTYLVSIPEPLIVLFLPEVAPQQSFFVLHTTVETKMKYLNNLLILSFQHLVITYNKPVNVIHEATTINP
jgi:hypothetical protein